jgi:hypothetical protein
MLALLTIALRKQRQEDHKSEASIGYIQGPVPKTKENGNNNKMLKYLTDTSRIMFKQLSGYLLSKSS